MGNGGAKIKEGLKRGGERKEKTWRVIKTLNLEQFLLILSYS